MEEEVGEIGGGALRGLKSRIWRSEEPVRICKVKKVRGWIEREEAGGRETGRVEKNNVRIGRGQRRRSRSGQDLKVLYVNNGTIGRIGHITAMARELCNLPIGKNHYMAILLWKRRFIVHTT